MTTATNVGTKGCIKPDRIRYNKINSSKNHIDSHSLFAQRPVTSNILTLLHNARLHFFAQHPSTYLIVQIVSGVSV